MTTNSKTKATIERSIANLEQWIEKHDYKGFDPADGLTSFLRPLTFGSVLLDRVLIQAVWKSPVNLRPLLGVKPLRTNIAMGYFAWGYCIMAKSTGDKSYINKAEYCLEWLINNRAPDFKHYSWGKMFDFISRGGRQAKFEPITVWTSLIGHAFIEAYELTGKSAYLEVAKSVCDWIIERPRNQTESGACINYGPYGKGDCVIHNQSMLAASMLARTARHKKNSLYLEVAEQAIMYSCTRQLPDGSWWYGEKPTYHWIDNFHTGYNLDGLKWYIECTGDKTYEENLKKGFSFYKNNFFEPDGKPKYYHNRVYAVDSQCAAQSIETLSNFAEHDKTALDLAVKVALWTIKKMQDRDGHFYYRQYPYITMKVPMIHWAQGTMYKALALLISALQEKK